MALAILVIIAVVISSAVDVVNGWQSALGVVGWVAVRLMLRWRDLVSRIRSWLVGLVVRVLFGPLKRLVLGPLMRSAMATTVSALLVLAILVWLVVRSTDNYPALIGAVLLAAAGGGGQYWWFRGRLSEWKAANPAE